MIFFAKISPKSSQNQLISYQDDILKVKLSAVPEKGKANQELISFLSKVLGIKKSDIQIISGATSSLKKLQITSIDKKIFEQKIRHQLKL